MLGEAEKEESTRTDLQGKERAGLVPEEGPQEECQGFKGDEHFTEQGACVVVKGQG